MKADKKTINVIEKDQDVNQLFKIYLECVGYLVDGFTNISDALLSFKNKRHDLYQLR
jgi:DNA-binding response OmpR family regulator